MVLFLQLAVEFVRVAAVEVDECGLRGVLLHLAQAAAGRLEHHVFGTVPLLGEDDPRQTAAVPALFPDLHQQNDADLGKGLIQTVKFHLAVCRLRVLLVAFVKFQDAVGGQAVFRRDAGCQRIDHLLQLFDGSAVDAQLGTSPVRVDRVFIIVQKLPNASVDDPSAVRQLRDLHDGSFEKIPHAIDQRIVVDDVGDLRRGDGEAIRHLDLFRFFQIGGTGETDNGIDGLIFRPLVDHCAELDLIADRVVDLVNEHGQGGQLSDQVSQLVGLPVLFIVALLKHADLSGLFLDAIQDHLLRIGHSYQAEQLRQRLVVSNLLHVGIFRFIRLLRRLGLIQHLKGQ